MAVFANLPLIQYFTGIITVDWQEVLFDRTVCNEIIIKMIERTTIMK